MKINEQVMELLGEEMMLKSFFFWLESEPLGERVRRMINILKCIVCF
jgi:hypothetical protein